MKDTSVGEGIDLDQDIVETQCRTPPKKKPQADEIQQFDILDDDNDNKNSDNPATKRSKSENMADDIVSGDDDSDGQQPESTPKRLRKQSESDPPNYNENVTKSDRARRNGHRKVSQHSHESVDISSDEENGGSINTFTTASPKAKTNLPDNNDKDDIGPDENPSATDKIDDDSVKTTPTQALRRSSRISGDPKKENQYVDLDGDAMMTTYTGSTEMIFVYPPGKRGSIRVTEEERGRLDGRLYLNDSLLDFYIKFLEMRIKRYSPDVHERRIFFSSFFFGRLRQGTGGNIDYHGVKSWTKNIDLFEQKYVFVPICDSYHWSVFVIVNLHNLQCFLEDAKSTDAVIPADEKPAIFYLDSLDPERGVEFGDSMCQYLAEEWYARKVPDDKKTIISKQQILDQIPELVETNRPRIPIQTNETDCGLYVLLCLQMFLTNDRGFKTKLLSRSSLSTAFSHIQIEKLRLEIISLIDTLKESWKWRTGRSITGNAK